MFHAIHSQRNNFQPISIFGISLHTNVNVFDSTLNLYRFAHCSCIIWFSAAGRLGGWGQSQIEDEERPVGGVHSITFLDGTRFVHRTCCEEQGLWFWVGRGWDDDFTVLPRVTDGLDFGLSCLELYVLCFKGWT